MAHPIEKKLVVGVASSALFDLAESDRIFREQKKDAYRAYQREHQKDCLAPGVAFPFIRRFLYINEVFPEERPVEVVLLSKNDPDTGLRVLNSIREHNLDITRAAFLSGKSPFPYIPAFNCSLFLSANQEDVRLALDAQYPAGIVLRTDLKDDPSDNELRIAFDFDGVLADDAAEKVYAANGDLGEFQRSESQQANVPLTPGPLQDLFRKLALLQMLEQKRMDGDPGYRRHLRTAIVTARGAPSHERVVTTLRAWGVTPDETFFLGGITKARILNTLKPHIYFDDQMTHLVSSQSNIPSVHVPFGVRNRRGKEE
jgi:5'-nucleotidase